MSGPYAAIYVDFENVAIGAREAGLDAVRLAPVVERVQEKANVILKRAYCDWTRYSRDRPHLHELGFELVEVPHVRYSGKNSADIRMAVDAVDVCHTKPHLDLFVVVSGDSDFSPLVAKLRENGKAVLGIGVKPSTSDLLVGACDEFVYYEDLVGVRGAGDEDDPLRLIAETASALLHDRSEPVWGSYVKQVLKRKRPNFNERRHGFRSFNEVLEAAGARGLLELREDEASGGYRVLSADSAA